MVQIFVKRYPIPTFLIPCHRAKINNKSELGLGYQQKLRDGVTLTLSSLVNTGTFSAVSIPCCSAGSFALRKTSLPFKAFFFR
jgi:hypothetical protein